MKQENAPNLSDLDWTESMAAIIYSFIHSDISELVNLQDVRGKAKPYQISQLLKIIERHNLKLED